ncbi:hypothetical protein Lal_00046786 [Lupinus albus]|nr:hypothetical protein Lal_00044241 [Lupinus albus]KAF1855748.1 hypothetical protein Lal_00045076 [Lupinus albus]KAF1855940.1 hypothetical protein Lal_00046706 [Lupinus albus]KAF1856491.1 hypothetical protein Lal_00046786 [Lupinus albus]
MPDRHLDQRDEGIKIFDLDLEEQAKNLLHAKCVMVPDKLTTRCPHFSVGPARTGTPCLGKLAGALGGSPMARHPDPPRQPWLNNSKLASKFGAIFMKGSAPYHAFTEIGNAPRTHVPIVDLAPTNRTQPSFAFLGKLAGALGGSPMARHPDPPRQPWLNNSKLASKFGAIFMKGSAPYHAFTEIGNASEAKKTHTRHGTCPWATFAFT